jgi:hypothetical protein
MQLTFILKTWVAYWVNLAVMTCIDWMAQHCGDYYYPALADTVKYILHNIFICIIKEQCSDHEDSKWKRYIGCHINVNDGLHQIKWLHIGDTPVAKWASMDCQQLWVMYLGISGGQQVANCHKWRIGYRYRQKRNWNTPCPIITQSFNRVSMIDGLPVWLITARCGHYCLHYWYWLFWYAKWLTNTL